MEANTRIDKFLWCVRLYKTRALSNEACNKSKIKVNTKKIKASYLVKIDDIISIKKKIITIEIRVKDILIKRISAKLVSDYIEDITPDAEKTNRVFFLFEKIYKKNKRKFQKRF